MIVASFKTSFVVALCETRWRFELRLQAAAVVFLSVKS